MNYAYQRVSTPTKFKDYSMWYYEYVDMSMFHIMDITKYQLGTWYMEYVHNNVQSKTISTLGI
jgi:hypothetical protein